MEMEIFKTCWMNLFSCAVHILHALCAQFPDEFHGGPWVVPHTLSRHRLLALGLLWLLIFSGKPAEVKMVLPDSLEVWEVGRFIFCLPNPTLVRLLCMQLLWLHTSVMVRFAAVSPASVIQGECLFLLPSMCSVSVLCLCLHGKLQICDPFRSPWNTFCF